MKDKIQNLLAALPEGKENAIQAAELSARLHIPPRSMRKVIHEARRLGYLILSADCGYYLPSCTEEIREFYESKRKKAVSLLAVLKTARKVVKESEETKE